MHSSRMRTVHSSGRLWGWGGGMVQVVFYVVGFSDINPKTLHTNHGIETRLMHWMYTLRTRMHSTRMSTVPSIGRVWGRVYALGVYSGGILGWSIPPSTEARNPLWTDRHLEKHDLCNFVVDHKNVPVKSSSSMCCSSYESMAAVFEEVTVDVGFRTGCFLSVTVTSRLS